MSSDDILGGLGKAAGAAGQLVSGALQISSEIQNLGGAALQQVRYRFTADGVTDPMAVTRFDLSDGLNRAYEITLRLSVPTDAHMDPNELVGKNCALTLERPHRFEVYKGFIREARLREIDAHHSELSLGVAPLLWMLTRDLDSRIYQDKSAPQVVTELYRRLLASRGRQVRSELTGTYPVREYIVQYQESNFAFLTRLCEEAGFFYYFEHEQDGHEILVLADAAKGRGEARDGEPVTFWHDPAQSPDGEAVSEARVERHIAATDVVIAEYDWTHPTLPARADLVDRSEDEPVLEVYDHTDIVTLHDYQNGAYTQNDAQNKARMTAERLDLERHRWSLGSTVITARVGRILRVMGCPMASLDAAYFVFEMTAHGEATENVPGSYENRISCVPMDVPFRPARRLPHPSVVGPETAIVVGPAEEEIHVDEHGRIKVQFHWDRQGQRNEHSSCWMRVMQAWSGPGWGSWWVPRIGMEVVVQFLGGNPDRPFISGTLYNGDNHTPYPLPDEKTKSTIKSNSSPGGNGSNEVRFEDKAGSEELYVHAQKDFNEVVEHDHSTTVHANQNNRVDQNHSVSVGANQSTSVEGNRSVSVTGNESYSVQKDRIENVAGSTNVNITGSYKIQVNGGMSRGDASDPPTPGAGLSVRGTYAVDSSQTISHAVGGCTVTQDGQRLIINAPTTILFVVGSSTIEMGTSSITLSSPTIVAVAGEGASSLALDGNATLVSTGTATVAQDGGAQLVLTPNALLAGAQVNVEGGNAVLELAGYVALSGDTAELRGGDGVVHCDGASVAVVGSTIKLN